MDINNLLKQKGITVNGGTLEERAKIYDTLKDLPYTSGLEINFIPKSKLQFPDRGIESYLGDKRIDISEEKMDKYGLTMPFEEALVHEYTHAIPERPANQYKWIFDKKDYKPWFEFKDVEPIDYYEEGLAESMRYSKYHPESVDEDTNKFVKKFLSGELKNEKVLLDNLYSRRSDLKELFDENGKIKDKNDKRVMGLVNLGDWYSQYGEEEYYKHLGANREDLKQIYDKEGNIISQNSAMAKDIPTIKDWWTKYGKQETADFITNENNLKNKPVSFIGYDQPINMMKKIKLS